MKKIVKLLAILLLTLTTCIAGGCFTPGGNSSSSSSISNSSSESSSEDSSESSSGDGVVFEGFAEDEITLLVGDKQKLEVEYGGLNKPASFKSSDYSVVAVDTATGTVTAKKAGEATITITYGNYTDTIVVNTTFGELIPVLTLKNPLTEETVNINEEVDVSVQVVFNENTFTASNVTYEIEKSDGTLATNAEATITNGKFIAKKEDTYTINFTAKWSNYQGEGLENSIQIQAIKAYEFYINGLEQTSFGFEDDLIYTMASFGGKTWNNQIPFEITVEKKGVAVDTEVSLTWKENGDCVTYNETAKTLTGKKAGVAVLEVACGTIKQEISINVTPVEAVYEGESVVYSALDGIFSSADLERVFGKDYDSNLYTAYLVEDGEKTTEFETKKNGIQDPDKVIQNLITKDKPADVILCISTDKVGYQIPVRAYTMVIKTQADLLDAFQLREDYSSVATGRQFITVNTNEQSGYYILANDIEYSGTAYRVLHDSVKYLFANPNSNITGFSCQIVDTAGAHTGGLTGTFDGNGYSIKNFLIHEYGLFGMINGGTVKNVNIKNVSLVGRYGQMQVALGAVLHNATLENVNISTTEAGITSNVYKEADGSIATASKGSTASGRALFSYIVSGKLTMKNCLFTVPGLVYGELPEQVEAGENVSNKWPGSMGALFCFISGSWGAGNTFVTDIKDTYVISPVKLGYCFSNLEPKNMTFSYDTGSVRDDFPNGSFYYEHSNAVEIAIQLENLIRYENVDEMINADNDYASFTSSGYWQLANGLPVWK